MNHPTIRLYILVLQFLSAACKCTLMECVQSYYLRTYLQQDLVTGEQNISEQNALYGTAHDVYLKVHAYESDS